MPSDVESNNSFDENDGNYLVYFHPIVDDFQSEHLRYFRKNIIQNDIGVDMCLNFEKEGDNHNIPHASNDVKDHPQKKRQTKKSIKEATDNKHDIM